MLEADAPPESASCILSLFKPGVDLTALQQKLSEAQIVTSLRVDRTGQKYIRISPHFYNTDAELQKLVDAI